jgi:uncharacterized membrane protein YgcG
MNGILAKSSNHGANKSSKAQSNNKPGQSVETAGSLAMWQQSLINAMMADSFSSSNPFVVDYAAFGISPDTVAYSGFLNSFSNALSVLGDGSFSDGGGGFGGGSFSAGGGSFSGGGGGSFSSTC